MSYEVEKFCQPKKEDYDNSNIDTDLPDFEVFRFHRCESEIGKHIIDQFNEQHTPEEKP